MANRYWVAGGTGNWNSTTNWSTASGGASGASVPSTSDAALLDASSGSGTVTLDISPTIQSLNCVGFTGTLAFGSQNITLNGNASTIYNQSTTVTITGTPVINCVYSGSTGTRTITGGNTEANAVSINVSAGTDTVTTTAIICKNLNFTGFAGTLSNNVRTIYGNLILSSGMTLTAGTGLSTFAATSGTQQITTNGKTLDFPVQQNGVGGTVQLQDALTLGSTRTFTLANGTLDLASYTLTTGLFSSNVSNTRSILFGTGNINVTGNNATVFNMATMTGFSYTGTPTVNCIYSGSTGTRTIAYGQSSSGGTESNALNLNISAGSDIVTFGGSARIYKNLDFTGFTGSYTNTLISISGNVIFSSGMTISSGTNVVSFIATSGTKQITTNGQTLDFPLNVNGIGGTFAFQDALTQGSTRAFTITNGTLQFKNGTTNVVGAFATSGTNVKYLQSTLAGSQATISQASGTVAVTYLNIKDSNATGGAYWNATDPTNVDAGNNTGWFLPTIGKFFLLFN